MRARRAVRLETRGPCSSRPGAFSGCVSDEQHQTAAYAHGPSLFPPLQASQQLRNRCHSFLLTQLPPEAHPAAEAAAGRGALPADGEEGEADNGMRQQEAGRWGITPFFVEQRPAPAGAARGARFNFRAPTTGRNALRVLRALQVRLPSPFYMYCGPQLQLPVST